MNKDGSSDPVADIKPPPTFLPSIPASPTPQSTSNSEKNTAKSDLMQQQQQQLPSSSVNRFSIKSQSNIYFYKITNIECFYWTFSMLKDSSMRNYYAKVDVMADQSKKLNSSNADQQVLAPMLSNMPPPSQLPPRFFVPPPIDSSQSQQDAQHNNGTPQAEDFRQQQQQHPQSQSNQQYPFQQQSNQQGKRK